MRSDMYKVIVERPRKGKSDGAKADRRRDDFEGPPQLGMRAGLGCRGLNENLTPLRRYLRAQIGRPWNKVYSEISAGIDRRNTVQLHIFAHLDQMIAVQVEWQHGRLVDLKSRHRGYGDDHSELRQELYVDPRSGLIRPNRSYRSYAARRRIREKAAEEDFAHRRRINEHTLLLLIDGEWYEVRMAPVPAFKTAESSWVFDVVLKRQVSRHHDQNFERQRELFGDGYLDYRYAASKRQLSRREIADYGLPREGESSRPRIRVDKQTSGG